MKDLAWKDKQAIKHIKEQFEPEYDARGNLVKEPATVALAQFGTVSLLAEAALRAEGYSVENVTPFCKVSRG